MKPVIIERFGTARLLGAGLLSQPTGLAVLERLGIRNQAALLGARIDHLYGRAVPDGPVTFDLRCDGLIPDLHGLVLHCASLFRLLHQAVSARGTAIERAAEIAGLDETGTRLRLREAIGAVRISPYRHGAVWGVASDTGFVRNALQQRYKSVRIMIGVLPVGCLPDDPTPLDAFISSMPVERLDRWHETDLAAWRGEVASVWPETATLTAQFTRHDHLTQARYAQLTVRSPWRGRLVLIGDAAHQTSPQLGQGANMALLDAVHLTDALTLHQDIDIALPAYAAQRQTPIRFYQSASAVLTQFFQSNSRLAGFIRDVGFAPMGKIPLLRTEMIRTLAGLKTGSLSWQRAEELAGLSTPGTADVLARFWKRHAR